MTRKGKQQKNDPPSSQGSTTNKAKQADSQLWTALKHEDEEELLSLLFDEVTDAESGEVRQVQKPTACKAVNQPNAKKVLPLTYAVSEGLSRTLLELLLRAGAAVNKKDETAEESTALHAACWNEDGEVVDLLLRAGADPRVVDAEGRTPLHVLATSNAANLVLQLLDSVSAAAITGSVEPTEGKDGAAYAAVTRSPSATLKLDPTALLAMPDKLLGATVLHLALGESTYNFGVAQALCDYLARVKDSSGAAVAQLVSARTTATGDSPLHALVAAANAEDAVVEAFVRRLLALGADPLARNLDGQSILEVAISSRPGSDAKSTLQLYETLLSPVLATEQRSFFFTEKNKSGQALIHVALAAANTSAVKAFCSAVPAAEAKALLGDPVTTGGISVVELLANAGTAEMANALIAANAVDRATYEAMRLRHKALQTAQQHQDVEEARRTVAQEEAAEDDAAGGENDDEDMEAAAKGSAMLASRKRRQGNTGTAAAARSGGGAGISRVQQARRARAATAAQRKQQPHMSGLRSSHEGGGGGLFGGGGLSTPVKVLGVLLLLSMVVSVYTTFFALNSGSVLRT